MTAARFFYASTETFTDTYALQARRFLRRKQRKVRSPCTLCTHPWSSLRWSCNQSQTLQILSIPASCKFLLVLHSWAKLSSGFELLYFCRNILHGIWHIFGFLSCRNRCSAECLPTTRVSPLGRKLHNFHTCKL